MVQKRTDTKNLTNPLRTLLFFSGYQNFPITVKGLGYSLNHKQKRSLHEIPQKGA